MTFFLKIKINSSQQIVLEIIDGVFDHNSIISEDKTFLI